MDAGLERAKTAEATSLRFGPVPGYFRAAAGLFSKGRLPRHRASPPSFRVNLNFNLNLSDGICLYNLMTYICITFSKCLADCHHTLPVYYQFNKSVFR